MHSDVSIKFNVCFYPFRDLETSVAEVRHDVLNKRCRVSMADVESMALALSNVGRSLADLKGVYEDNSTLTICDGYNTIWRL